MKRMRTGCARITIIGLVCVMMAVSGSAYAQMPKKINYQGYLADNAGAPVNGNVQMGFAIYDVASGGSALWSETQSVTLSDGRYSVSLGAVASISLTEAKPYWLGVRIGSDPEMTPRKEMTGTLYDVIQGNLSSNEDGAWVVSGENVYRETGNVGIGVKPGDAIDELQVSKAKPGKRVTIRAWNTDTTNAASDAMLYARTGKGGGDSLLLLGLQGVVNWFIGADRSDDSKLKIGRTGLASIDSGNTLMTFNNSGNIGIATTNPRERLEVNGLIHIPRASNQDNNSPGITAVSNDDFLYDGEYINHYGFGFHTFTDVHHGVNAYIAGYYGIDFFTGGQNRLRISNNGNVHVHKTLKAREIVVDTKKWYDFVFEDDYELMPLSEVEQHIKTHGHLPEIPSEREVLENGVSVGEMQARLLQKVEELTLHLIEQDKKLTTLQRENETLKEELSTLKHVR